MSRLLILAAVCFQFAATAGEFIEVKGEKEAYIKFKLPSKSGSVPEMKIKDNLVEIDFPTSESVTKKVDVNSPHILINRITLIPLGDKLRAQVVVNGSLEKLADRLKLSQVNDQVQLAVEFPKGITPTLDLLKEEHVPLISEKKEEKIPSIASGWGQVVTSALILLVLLSGGLYGYQVMRKRGKTTGTRKFLVEQVNYSPIGPGGKVGVSLVKVGTEFVLVGVTANQVNMITRLPKLEEQYEKETEFERSNFRDAVEKEYSRLRGSEGANA